MCSSRLPSIDGPGSGVTVMPRISKVLAAWLGLALATTSHFTVEAGRSRALAAQAKEPSAVPTTVTPQRALLDRYCVSCHNERAKKAGTAPASLALDSVD